MNEVADGGAAAGERVSGFGGRQHAVSESPWSGTDTSGRTKRFGLPRLTEVRLFGPPSGARAKRSNPSPPAPGGLVRQCMEGEHVAQTKEKGDHLGRL